jgi:hypothetical protein
MEARMKTGQVRVRYNCGEATYSSEEFDGLLYKFEQRGFIRGLRSAARTGRRWSADWFVESRKEKIESVSLRYIARGVATTLLARDIDRHASRLERKMRGK